MYFSKTALLSLALLGAVNADSVDLLVKYSWTDGFATPVYHPVPPNLALTDIPCGGSRTIKFQVDYKNDRNFGITVPPDAKIDISLFDKDGQFGDILNPLDKKTEDFDSDHEIEFTFSCTEFDLGCKLDYAKDVPDFLDGETSSYVKLTTHYFPNCADDNANCGTVDYEETSLLVGCKTTPVVEDDPHVKTWGGNWYDFMGECDLVFTDAPNFAVDMPMKIHIRTKARYDYSFIESAVVMIGCKEEGGDFC